uniref:DUF5686 family protein n=3 Tax=Flavobacterium sp. TaxID=239 RepID=UPI004049BDEE
MKQICTWISIWMLTFLNAQTTTLEGIVRNEENNETLAFATLIFNNNPRLGITSDINGYFKFETNQKITQIQCSYVGFTKKIIPITNERYFEINLTPSEELLNEVVLSAEDNPANRIIRKVIANKDENNPENIRSFTYKSYNKTIFDFKTDKNKKDSLELNKVLKGGYVMMMESVSERKYLYPNKTEEVVIGTKVSGFKKPNFASLATDLQPFSFYQNNIPLFDIQYLNPIANGSLQKYNFNLVDEYYQNNDTIFIISYRPKKGKNVEGLKGVLHINSNKYAVQSVTASPFEKGKIDITIQQKYQFVDNKWFPEQLNYVMSIVEFDDNEMGVVVDGKSYISDVVIEAPLDKKSFAIEQVRMAENASKQDSLFWVRNRFEPLKKEELITYRVIDSLGEKFKFDKFLSLSEKLANNRIPLGIVDIDIPKTLVFNRYEGTRLGLGLITNEKFSKKLTLSSFGGYGLNDYQWKYGGTASYEFSKRNEFKFGIGYQNNLNEIGNNGFERLMPKRLQLRDFLALNMDEIREYSTFINFRAFRRTQWFVKGSFTSVNPLYEYVFSTPNQDITNYKNAEIAVGMRWAPQEKIVQSFNQRVALVSNKPVFTFLYARGLEGFYESNFAYNKLEISAEQSFYSKNFGKTTYRIEGGYIDEDLPIGLLFTGEGSFVKKYPYFMKNTFQTMQPYEFVSDQYANLFLIHNFGTLLFKSKLVQPSLSVHHNMSWGRLENPASHQFFAFQTKEKVFTESGLQVDNILKINYLNVGYLGVGGSVFYRYGAYELPESNDNLVWKLSFTFTIK